MKLSAWLTLLISFLICILLMIAPVAPWLSDIWPVWILPLIIYWIMALPHRVGLLAAWISGILLDILFNNLIGMHALALLIVAAIFSKMARRFSFFSGLQQMFVIAFLSVIYLLILAAAQLYSGQPLTILWWQVLTTTLAWPVISMVLRHYRQRFRMT